mmetsp:Transcript_128322/g.348316  ORF Transcript_128322/g.348316 Transcript_128322/m.348316 type:complete len:206 (-) Transcript_128322:578-1195(-)
MGRLRGTTTVRMRMHLRMSSCGVFSPFASPSFSTYPAATSANESRTSRATRVSFVSPDTFSCENSIIWSSSPWEDEKPVHTTKQRQPPSGVLGTLGAPSAPHATDPAFRALPSDERSSFVPEKRLCTRSGPCMSSARSSTTIASFICGADSPVKLASLTMASPRTMTQSQGTMSQAAASAATFSFAAFSAAPSGAEAASHSFSPP